jgi:hypothetical protein
MNQSSLNHFKVPVAILSLRVVHCGTWSPVSVRGSFTRSGKTARWSNPSSPNSTVPQPYVVAFLPVGGMPNNSPSFVSVTYLAWAARLLETIGSPTSA